MLPLYVDDQMIILQRANVSFRKYDVYNLAKYYNLRFLCKKLMTYRSNKLINRKILIVNIIKVEPVNEFNFLVNYVS